MAGGFAASNYGCSPVRADIQNNPNYLYDPCIPSVSDQHCKPFSAGFCDRGPKPSPKSRLSSIRAWYPCLLSAIFEGCHGQKNGREEALMKLDMKKHQAATEPLQKRLRFHGPIPFKRVHLNATSSNTHSIAELLPNVPEKRENKCILSDGRQ